MIWVKITLSLAVVFMAICAIGMATVEHDRTQAALRAIASAAGVGLVASCIGVIWSMLP